MNVKDSTKLDQFTIAGFNNIIFLDTSYPFDNDTLDLTDLTFQQVFQTKLLEKEGWFGYYDPEVSKTALCVWYDMEPKRERFDFYLDKNPYNGIINQLPEKNWE